MEGGLGVGGELLDRQADNQVPGLAGNVGVVSGISPPQNDRHVDMSSDMAACWRQHVSDIEPCWLLRCRVNVVSA